MRSIRARLVAVTLLVTLAAVVTTAWVANRETSREVRGAVEDDLRVRSEISQALAFHAYSSGTWAGVDDLVADLAADSGERIALTDLEGILIADSARVDGGEGVALPDAPVGFIDPSSPVISFGDAPETPFLRGLEEMIAEGDALSRWLDTAGIDFSAAADPFGIGYPVWDEADGFAEAMVDRFFRMRLVDPDGAPLFDPPAELLDLLGDQAQSLSEFLDRLDVAHDVVEGPLGLPFVEWDLTDDEANRAVADFYTSGLFGEILTIEDIAPFGVPEEAAVPALLFMGFAEEPATPPGTVSWRLLGAVAALGLAVVAVTILAARRLLGPIGELTGAARRLEAGELSQRVAVQGGDEVAVLAGAFNSMAASLERQDELRRALTGDVAHELRTPLSNIRGYLEAIQEGVATPSPEVIASIHEEAVHLQRLIDDLQELSLAESGHLAIDRVATALGPLLSQAAAAHRPAAEAAGVTLVCEASETATPSVDGGRIRQVIGNLIDNAIRHTPDGGRVDVSLHTEPGAAIVTVTDTGVGIAPEHLPFVFERLYRADPSRARATGGTGLGLAIARELVRAHGGDIGVESSPGRGSRFTVRLPLEPADE